MSIIKEGNQMNDRLSRDLSGLPQEVLDQLKGSKNRTIQERRHCPTQKKMLALLKDGPLQLDDIVISFYRDYGRVMKRSSATQIMHTLKCRGFIERQGTMEDRFYAITYEGKEYWKNAEPKERRKASPKHKESTCKHDPISPIIAMEEISSIEEREVPKKSWIPSFLRPQSDH